MRIERRTFLFSFLSSFTFLAAWRPRLAAAQVGATPDEVAKLLLEAAPAHGERSLGDPKAPVVMIEYASATCPHCAEFHVKIWPMIKKDFVETGKVRFLFREFPLDQTAMGAFMLARCVPEDKYFVTIDTMFRQQETWRKNPKDGLFRIVGMAGLSEQDADACLKKQDLAQSIYQTTQKANKEFGVKGTPTFFVNGTLLDGHEDPESVRKGIVAALAKLGLQ
jgi:protein-disulfide isomerase